MAVGALRLRPLVQIHRGAVGICLAGSWPQAGSPAQRLRQGWRSDAPACDASRSSPNRQAGNADRPWPRTCDTGPTAPPPSARHTSNGSADIPSPSPRVLSPARGVLRPQNRTSQSLECDCRATIAAHGHQLPFPSTRQNEADPNRHRHQVTSAYGRRTYSTCSRLSIARHGPCSRQFTAATRPRS